jgi:hypothetical protein
MDAAHEKDETARLSDDTLAHVLYWVGQLCPMTLGHVVPDVCERWRELCKTVHLGAYLDFHIHVSQTVLPISWKDTPCRSRIAIAVHKAEAMAARHCRPYVGIGMNGEVDVAHVKLVASLAKLFLNGLSLMPNRQSWDRGKGHACLEHLMATCKHVTTIAMPTRRFARYMTWVERERTEDDAMIHKLCERYPLLETVGLGDEWAVNEGGLRELARCRNLRKIDVMSNTLPCTSMDAAYAHVLRHCPSLTIDNICGNNVGEKTYAAAAQLGPTHRRSWRHDRHTTELSVGTVQAFLASHQPGLEHVTLRGRLPYEDFARAVLLGCSQTLTKLVLAPVYGGHALQLDMGSVIEGLTACTKLSHLELHTGSELYPHEAEGIGLACGSRLSTLCLIEPGLFLSDTAIADLASQCVKLKHLVVTGTQAMRACVMDALDKHCPLLESLSMQACGGWVHQLVPCGHLPELRALSISAYMPTQDLWEPFARITHLSVTGTTHVVGTLTQELLMLTTLLLHNGPLDYVAPTAFKKCLSPITRLGMYGYYGFPHLFKAVVADLLKLQRLYVDPSSKVEGVRDGRPDLLVIAHTGEDRARIFIAGPHQLDHPSGNTRLMLV